MEQGEGNKQEYVVIFLIQIINNSVARYIKLYTKKKLQLKIKKLWIFKNQVQTWNG